jgi:hypothetical protein
MEELTGRQIERKEYVDDAIFNLIQELNPTSREIEFDMEIIGEIREQIQYCIVERLKLCDEMTFSPYVERKS